MFFFSYARQDSQFVLKLAKELRAAGVSLWVDQLDIVGGARWDEAVQAALESCEGMLAVLSPTAVSSRNVMDEVSYALEEGKQIIPVLYKECGVPFRLRRVQRVDFSVSYDKGFADLLKALNVSRPAARPTSAAREISDCERPEAELAGPEVKQKAEQYARKQSGKLRERGKTAMIGAVAGAVFGTIAVFLWGRTYEQELWWLGALLAGVPTAITGALTGTNWKVILAAAVAAVVGTVIVVLVGGSNELLGALLYGTPLSALLGALSAVAWFRIVARHNTTLNRSGG